MASLTDFDGKPDPIHLGAVVSAPNNLATVLNEPKQSPNFIPVYNSGFVYGPLDATGVYLFAYRDFSDANDAKFLMVGIFVPFLSVRFHQWERCLSKMGLFVWYYGIFQSKRKQQRKFFKGFHFIQWKKSL